jgi:cell division protein ZipA
MSGRELVILLLGLAIVAVVLRGLYVAINARRGQIKLAIDKNIPQDVDLESLELAELPGGGARVVTRSLEEVNRQNSALDLAESKSKSLHLTDSDDDSHIPVLMDAVELSVPALSPTAPNSHNDDPVEDEPIEEAVQARDNAYGAAPLEEVNTAYIGSEQAEQIEAEVEEDFLAQASQAHSLGEDWDEAEEEVEVEPDATQYADVTVDDENVASNADALSSVAPDYDEEPEEELVSDAGVELVDDKSYEDFAEDEYEQQELAEEQLDSVDDEEEQATLFDADSSAEKFSMTAGERIGGNPPAIGEVNQSGLFDDIEEEETASTTRQKGGRTLFSLFGRKSKNSREIEERVEGESFDDAEPDDVLFEEVPEQAELDQAQEQSATVKHTSDFDESHYEEPSHSESLPEEDLYDEEIVDELDQKRAASSEYENQNPVSREQEPRSEEFEHSEVLVLNVTAKEGRVFAGDDLLHVLITAGLKFGDMNIFHKRLSKQHQGTVIFSVANMLNPGTFDLNNMEEFTTLGISFFLALPSPINNLDAFEQMLGIAQEIRDTLDGDLKDDHRNGMTGQTIEHYRQRIRDFELKRLKAIAARG